MSESMAAQRPCRGAWFGVYLLACLLLALPGGLAFLPNFWSRVLTLSWDSHTHQYMTEQALLNITLDTLDRMPVGREGAALDRGFWRAVAEVVWANAAMDFLSATRSDPVYHFDSERVEGAADSLRLLWSQTLLSVGARDYQGARRCLGQLFHSLQDFYSHSNWVEMGQRSVYLHLLHPEQPAIPVASDTPTCADCHSSTCMYNIVLSPHPPLLTTGYFSRHPAKPAGKCSHGGLLDSSRHQGARGGINKDSTSPLFSPHHYLHGEAARLATTATMAVLQDLRDAVGTVNFLRLLSVRQQPALVFVMDTTGSMFEEITAARLRAFTIIQARTKTTQQPGTYLLVPFHDPAVGPVYETEDPEMFMQYLEGLTALGGGDEPEMCLSAVLLALTHSPPLSEIFVFTDASPKDAHLYSAVEALTLEKRSKVSFLLTEDPNLSGTDDRGMRKKRESLSDPDRFSLYSSLSSVSGGLAIFTSNSDIKRVSTIIQDNIAASKVTLLHVESNSVSVSTRFPFRVDSEVNTVTVHLTGILKHCVLTSPSGQRQSLLDRRGSLAELERFQGLYRISLFPPIEPGEWSLSADTEGLITLNAIGTSSVDFLYHFAVVANGTHPGLARVEGSPVAGVPTFLVLAVTGLQPNDEASFSHVTLLGANGESLLKVPLNSSSSLSSGKELVGSMVSVPRQPFCVRLSGKDGRGNRLERVATEMIQPTHIQIQVLSAPHLVPGHTSTVSFDVWNHGPARHFTLTATDDHGFLTQRGPHRVSVGESGSLRRAVELRTPGGTEPGTAVTLTLTVQALDTADSNYAVVHLIIIPPDPDELPPSCSPMRVEATCPPVCRQASWTVSLSVTDRGRSGLAALQLSEGSGVLTPLLGQAGKPWQQQENGGDPGGEGGQGSEQPYLLEGAPPLNVTGWGGGAPLHVRYSASCCARLAELIIWDGAGNSRRCHLTSSQQGATPKPSNGAGGKKVVLLPFLAGLLGGRLMV
ncbi:von Willebrand factor A domain-containing protein 7 isoform X2 [Conger conger]|uniref:von Willebrand factor A domain-containing protein 7 isoform X2 n=1 Tax=Conger conger TaxID=82655 RepID=UPI002A5AD433|nr:von Willebrand factor A domain-containing protein 7 isoform X2 [Conger conger]